MRRIDDLSPSEQAENRHQCLCRDDRRCTAATTTSIRLWHVGDDQPAHLFIGYMILLLLVGAYFLITTPKAFTTNSAIWVPLIVVLGAALYCAAEFFWLMIASWFGDVLDRHLFDKI